jgi:hypothetical protein
MTPTPRLRFFERAVPAPEYGENLSKTVRTLQQWWEKSSADQYTAVIAGDPLGEWRDVPIEKEN